MMEYTWNKLLHGIPPAQALTRGRRSTSGAAYPHDDQALPPRLTPFAAPPARSRKGYPVANARATVASTYCLRARLAGARCLLGLPPGIVSISWDLYLLILAPTITCGAVEQQ